MQDKLSILQQADGQPRSEKREKGDLGEALAAAFLEQNGYRLVMANFTAPIGRNSKGVQVRGEIDLVALDGETLCFVEVKTRSNRNFGGPLTAVDNMKQRQITRTSRIYRRIFGVVDRPHRFDVVTVVTGGNGPPEIELIRGFWDASKFSKRRWHGEFD